MYDQISYLNKGFVLQLCISQRINFNCEQEPVTTDNDN